MKSTLKNNSKKIKTVAFTELEDKYFGKKGTGKRNLYEARLNE